MKARLPLIVVFLFLIVLELISAKIKGQVAGFAAVLWLLQYLIIAASTIYIFFKLIFNELRAHSLFAPIFYLLTFTLLMMAPFAAPFINLNYESSLQVAAGLDAFSQPDLSYFGTAFIGYGARQYLINALPTLIWGRSSAALNFGFFQMLILGWMAFSSGIFRWTQRLGIPLQYAIIPSAAVLFTPILADYYFIFEQTSSPPAIALLLIGWGLIYLEKKDSLSIFIVAWVACLAYYSYTPSLSLLGLLIFLAGILILDKRNSFQIRLDSTIVVAFILSFIIAAVLFTKGRSDGALEGLNFNPLTVLMVFKGVIVGQDGNLISGGNFGILTIPIIIYALIAISGRAGRYHAALIFWAICVYVASVSMKGYTGYDAYYAMTFRTQHVTPILIAGLYFLISTYNTGHVSANRSIVNFSIVAVFFAFFISCFYTSHKIYWLGPKNYKMKFIINDMHKDMQNLRLLGMPVDAVAYISTPNMNFYDYAKYHFSDIKYFSIMDYKIPDELLACRNVVMYGDASAIVMKDQEGLKIFERNVRDYRSGENYKYYRFEVSKTQRSDGVGCL